MKWILFFFLIGALAVLSVFYLRDPGYIEVIWLGYEVQLTVFLALFFFLFLFFLIILLGYVISWVFEIPVKWGMSLRRSRDEKIKNELIDFLSCYEAEEFSEAQRYQKKLAQILENNPFFLWVSGNLFEKEDQYLEAEECFVSLTKNPFTSFLGLKGKIRSSLHRNDFKLAYTLLKRAEKMRPTSPWILKHLLALARQQNDFEKIEKLILRLKDLNVFTSDQSQKQMAQIQYQKAFQPKISFSQKEVYLRQAHHLDPSFAEATEKLALVLKEQSHISYALTILETTWKLTPTQKLGDLYLTLSRPRDDLEAFQFAQSLVRDNPENSESLLFLARAALKAKLWGEARSSLNLLLKKNPTASIYQLLARIELEEKQDPQAAIRWLEEGLQMPRHE